MKEFLVFGPRVQFSVGRITNGTSNVGAGKSNWKS